MCGIDSGAILAFLSPFIVAGIFILWGIARNQKWRDRR